MMYRLDHYCQLAAPLEQRWSQIIVPIETTTAVLDSDPS